MSFYTFNVTTPKNTLASAPLETNILIHDGVIHRLEAFFPVGSEGCLKVQLFDREFQIAPLNRGESLVGNQVKYEGNMFYEIEGGSGRLTLKTVNLDTGNDHQVIVNVWMLPRKFLLPIGATEGILESIKSLFGRR